jgi:hypothetical protein
MTVCKERLIINKSDKDGPIRQKLRTTIMKIMRKYEGKFLENLGGGGMPENLILDFLW